ncbi:hypothetical protein ACFFUB_02370 [Algimonas porphyrae]|uniref:DUF2163 domain-containing protein n=1 Tax=Algimonas porphyrae TaxID=1128113 RepID=A0ABQ5UZ25_9PROT|nr:hypothetical protein [Algimonas porphyrae]GLQ20398.1 hypothetical protein GCM10007854_13530 [Algimonas porphyrae]
MSYAAAIVKLCAVLRIDLPGHAVRLSEGGEVDYEGDRYTPIDSVLGIVEGFDDVTSGAADEAPAFELVWGVRDIAAAVLLSTPASQNAHAEWRVLAVDTATNAILADEPIFIGRVDSTELVGDLNQYSMRMGFTTELDRLLNTDKGNRLNRSFHRSVWPGEAGLDLMTGTTVPVPWGDATRSSRGGGGGGGGSGNTRLVSLV